MNIAVALFTFVAVIVVVWWMISRIQVRQIREAKRQGFYPLPGEKPTMDHVRALVRAGHKISAIKFYREIHGTGLKEAKDEVEKLV